MLNPMQMISGMIQQNPQLSQFWNTAQQMVNGKSPEQIQNIANNLMQQNGLDMNRVMQTIQRFMGGNMPR